MRDVIKSIYNIEPVALIKYTDKVYKVACDDEVYSLKFVDNNDNEKLIDRLNYLHIDSFLLPCKNNIRSNKSFYKDKQFYLYNWIEDDYIDSKDLKLKYYFNRISILHKESSFTNNVPSSFYKEIKMQLEELQQETFSYLDGEISNIEKNDYLSPFSYVYLMFYHDFIESLDKSKKCLDKFSSLVSNKNVIRQVIIHNNFSYDHVFLSKDKIIGNEKMKIASPIEDLINIFNSVDFGSIDISYCLKEYLNNFELEEYEKYWLMANLYIIKYKKTNDDFSTLVNLNQSLFRIKSADEIANILNISIQA